MDYIYKTKPYKHQAHAFLASRDEKNFALLMEMGCGKTKVTLDTGAWLYNNGNINALLVVAPNGVHRNWILNEIPIHFPDYIDYRMAYWSASPKKEEKNNLAALWDTEFSGMRILSMNVEAFSTKRGAAEAEKFLNVFNALFVVDESSKMKNPSASRTKTLLRLSKYAPYKRILNGTLITQSPLDAYTQFTFLDPEILDFHSYYAFKNHYANYEKKLNHKTNHTYQLLLGYKNLKELQQKIQGHSYRVLKSDCLDLPPKIFERWYVELTAEQKRLYKEVSARLKVEFMMEKTGSGTINAKLAITKLLRLQQIVGGYVGIEDDHKCHIPFEIISPDRNPKMKALMDIVEEIQGKVIIWSRFVKEIEMLVATLQETYGKDSVVAYYGGVDSTEKVANVAAFQDQAHVRFFVGQQHSAGYGLTLTAANTVVYFSNDFSLEARLQSEDRAHRIGQDNKVTYIDLEAEHTIDSKIIKALRGKKNLADLITGDNVTEWL